MSLGTSNRDGGKTSESGHLRALAKTVYGDIIEGFGLSQKSGGGILIEYGLILDGVKGNLSHTSTVI